MGGRFGDKGKAMAAGCTCVELQFRELPVARVHCSLTLQHL